MQLLKYVVITPAYNEEEYLPFLLESMIGQTHQAAQLIIVNDGSTDETAKVVEKYGLQHDWIKLVNNTKKEKRAPGAKVVRAFLLGFEQLDVQDYDFIVKLDADLSLPEHYFETIAKHFQQNEQLGMVGGVCSLQEDGVWIVEKVADDDHIRGALKAYRTKIYNKMGGLRTAMGWDTVDELLCRYYGWQVKVDPSLVVKHHRPTNKEVGFLKGSFKCGKTFHYMRYSFLLALLGSLKRGMVHKPPLKTIWYTLKGYISAWCNNEPPIVDEQQGAYIRQYRYNKIQKKIKQLFK